MRIKILFRFSVAAVMAGALTLLMLQTAPVRAQCGEPQPSSCITCHARQDPIAQKGEWHVTHAGKDICINCHGGNASTMDKNLAHEGLMAKPLADIYTDCHSCHVDYDIQAAKYAPSAGFTPGSCATPTAVAVSDIVSGPPSSNIAMPSVLAPAVPPMPYSLIGGGAAMLAFFFIALRWLAGRHT